MGTYIIYVMVAMFLYSFLRLLANLDAQQLLLIYIALYLLIWGEASNIRFMPECICYIFHKVYY